MSATLQVKALPQAQHQSLSLDSGILEMPSSKVDEFFWEYRSQFSTSGEISFLRSLGIPASFFKGLTQPTQEEVLTQKKFSKDAPSFAFLMKDNQIVYGARIKESGIQFKDVEETLSNAPGTKVKHRVDYISGLIKYNLLFSPNGGPFDQTLKGEYVPAVSLNIPIFYQGTWTADLGLYKLLCTNGLLDKRGVSRSALKLEASSQFVVDSIFPALIESLQKRSSVYINLIQKMKALPADTTVLRMYVDEMLIEQRVPKTVLIKSRQHADIIDAGQATPAVSPNSVSSVYDVMDTLTYYAARLPTAGSESKSNAEISSFLQRKIA